ncbi:MAG: hypothetical protein Q7U13_08945 [Rhodoferax sp.]|nr:hypothetical protein [Rhodoferax sp.]
MSTEQEILNLIGKIVAYGGGAAVVAYGIFRFLGQKWIENKFAEKLEAYKHKQQQELEETRYRINSLFSRVSKIHEKEFQVLPTAWGKLHHALSSLSRFTTVVKRYPNFDVMTESQLEEVLKQSVLSDFQKKEIKDTNTKLDYFRDCMFYHELNKVKNACGDFHDYIQKNSIFLKSDLKMYFTKIDALMWDTMIDKEIGYEVKDHKMKVEAWKRVKDEVVPLRDQIEQLVQDRLRYDKAE